MYFEVIKKAFVLLSRSKSTYLILASSLLFFGAFFFLFVKVDHREVLTPTSKSNVHFFGDSIDGGNSRILQTKVSDSSIAIKYILKKGFVTPYAGMTLNDFDNRNDFSRYNKIKIKVKGSNIDNIYMHVNTKDIAVKNKEHRLADRISAVNISLVNGVYEKPISLDMFETPSWWFHVINQPISDFGNIAWDKLVKISVVTGIPPILDTEQRLEISSIVFYNDYFYFKVIVSLSMVLIVLSLYVYHFLLLIKSSKVPIFIEYKPINTSATSNSPDVGSLLSYIHENYDDPELNLSKVAKNIGVQERVISKYINDNYACNFRTYIQNIRITEAKRLISSSSLSISEIAYKVGFSDPSFFSKTFKKVTGKSPSSVS